MGACAVVIAKVLTDGTADDPSSVPALVEQIEAAFERFAGDDAYDRRSIYDVSAPRGTRVVVPPSRSAIDPGGDAPAHQARDASFRRVREVGRRRWRKESGHHLQARVENTFFRYEPLLGDRLRVQGPAVRKVEARLACNILNRMLELGATKSCSIGV